MAEWWESAPKADSFDIALQQEGVTGRLADVARSIYQQESGSGKNTRTSNAGAVGGMQIIPSTFSGVADKGWDINDPIQNARAGIRYVKQGYEASGGDPALTGAFYYGGPGGLAKARSGVAVSDPRNPNAPTTLQYGQQVASRLPQERGLVQRAVEAVIPSANAEEMPQGDWWSSAPIAEQESTEGVPRVTVAGTSTSPEPLPGVLDTAIGIARGSRNVARDIGAGALRGAGSIGATLLTPIDAGARALGIQNDFIGRTDRREAMDSGLRSLGANPDSLAYGAGKLGAEIAGTAGVGSALAAPLRAVPALGRLATAIGSAGMTVGPGGSAAGNLLARAAGGAITGGASAGLVNPSDAGTGALIGGALPVVAQGASRVGGAIGRSLTGGQVPQDVASLANRAKELGIDIPVDRLTNSKPLNALASSLDYVPFSGRGATMDKMQGQLNRALSRTFGQDSDNVTMALRKASGDLGGEFDRVLKQNAVRVDQQLFQDLGDVSAQATKELAPDAANIINKQIDDIARMGESGAIDGNAAYNIKRTLDRISNRNSPEAFYARDLKSKLMEALDRSLGPQEAQAFAKTRQQYGAMLQLENIAQNGVDGNVSIARIANMKNIRNPELQELADISAQFLKNREGQHGAAQRAYGTLGAAAAGYLGGPATAAAGLGAGRVANTLLNSNAARNAVLGTQQTNPLLRLAGEPDLAQLFYRGAPVAASQ